MLMKGCVSVLYDIFPVQSRPKVFFQYQFLQSLIEGVVETWFNALLNSSCLTPYRSCRGNSSKMRRFPQVEMRALPVWRHIRGDAMYYESSFLAFVEL